jgi:uncharacterized protein (TIGR03435 family)
MGGEPQVYAESILKVCEFYLASPVACAAGVTGGELKTRIEGIMTNRIFHKLNLAQKLLLAVAAIGAVAGPIAAGLFGQAAPQQTFEVASVKPSANGGSARGVVVRGGPGSTDPGLARFENLDLFSFVTMAYGIQRYQLSGPDWTNTERFDISAKLPQGSTREQYRLMLQNLLVERFKLALHREKKEVPIYELVIGKNGSKLKESADDPAAAEDRGLQPPARVPPRPPMGVAGSVGVTMSVPRMSMERFVAFLSDMLDRTVTDATGLTGRYDIKLHGTLGGAPAGDPSEPPSGGDPPAAAVTNREPSIFDAVEEQLGLKLVRKKGLVDILVIDHVEKEPTAN